MGSHKVSFSVLCLLVFLAIESHVGHAQCPKAEFLNSQNDARSSVDVGVPLPPLVWNNTLASYAQNYANKHKSECQLVHSGGTYGENLAGSTGDLSCADAVKLWIDEKPYYDYTSNECVGGMCGHYTQVVWRNSTQVGCAKVRCDNGGTFIGCNYYPPGNYIGERPY